MQSLAAYTQKKYADRTLDSHDAEVVGRATVLHTLQIYKDLFCTKMEPSTDCLSSTTIVDMPHDVAEAIARRLPLEIVFNPHLMKRMFPLASWSHLATARLNPRQVFSKIVSEPREIMEAMLVSDTVLSGYHAIEYFSPGFEVPSGWEFFCSADKPRRLYFVDYMLSKGMVVYRSLEDRVLSGNSIIRDRIQGHIAYKGVRHAISIQCCGRDSLQTVMERLNSKDQCFIAGYGCGAFNSELSLYQSTGFRGIEYLHPDGITTREQEVLTSGKELLSRHMGDKYSLALSYSPLKLFAEDLNSECQFVFSSLPDIIWKEGNGRIWHIMFTKIDRTLGSLRRHCSSKKIIEACAAKGIISICASRVPNFRDSALNMDELISVAEGRDDSSEPVYFHAVPHSFTVQWIGTPWEWELDSRDQGILRILLDSIDKASAINMCLEQLRKSS